MGEKPLYYGTLPNGDFVFASELKALRVHPHWRGEINRDALTLLMRHNAIAAPHTIYKGIFKLRPGHCLTWHADKPTVIFAFWDMPQVARQQRDVGLAQPLSDDQAIAKLEEVLGEAVRGLICCRGDDVQMVQRTSAHLLRWL
jgi:asparagine synthase (glutamine-hydrolysing)